MLSLEEARTRVARGAAHLDQVRPGWFNRIDVGTLTLSSPCRCVLAQAYSELRSDEYDDDLYTKAAKAAGLRWLGPAKETIDLGFYCYGDDYGIVQDAWIEAIADRRLASAKLIETPEPVSEPVGA